MAIRLNSLELRYFFFWNKDYFIDKRIFLFDIFTNAHDFNILN